MAYILKENDICYLHIPKTSGTWVKRVLGEIEYGTRDGSVTHDLPHRWNYKTIFTVVREPAEWLASVWAHRVRTRWEPYPQRIPWQYLCQLLDTCRENKFPKFVDRLVTSLPGVVGWFYSFYTPPGVTVLRKEYDVYTFLESLGGRPYHHEPVNIGSNVPEVTDELRYRIMQSEVNTYKKYGYIDATHIRNI